MAYYFHPVNIQTACLIMEGAEFTVFFIMVVRRPSSTLFPYTTLFRSIEEPSPDPLVWPAAPAGSLPPARLRSEEHTSELQSLTNLVCRLPLEKKNIPSTFKRPVSSWKALNLRKTLLMASSVRFKQLNCSRLPCVYAQETLTFLLTQKKTCVKNYVQKE